MSYTPAKTNQNTAPVQRLKEIVNLPSVQEQINNAMGESAGLFTASLVDIYTNDTTIQKCDPKTVVMEALKAATLRLPINKDLGFAYIVPYKNKATMQIGYKGYVQLAMRTGQYRYINAGPVYEGELRSKDKLTGSIDLTGEATSERVVGYFAYIETISGFKKTTYWTQKEVTEHAKKYSQTFSSQYSPWKTNFDAMGQKTVLKHLLSKYGVMSVELVRALQEDEERKADVEAKANENGEVLDIDTGEVEDAGADPTESPVADQGGQEEQQNVQAEPGF